MDARRRFGNRGEARAERELKRKGYKILERQFRTRFGEVDLIARDGNEIVFVEVKTRRSSVHGFPEEVVTETKLRRLERAAEVYLRKHALEQCAYRFDVVAIVGEGEEMKIEHLVGV